MYIKYFVLFTCILLFSLFVFFEFYQCLKGAGKEVACLWPIFVDLFILVHLHFQPLFTASTAIMPK